VRVPKLRPFIAWDGEGAEPEFKKAPQRYVLMAASNGYPHLYRPEGIGTREAFDWLLGLTAAHPGIHVGFGTAYDVNMILADVDPAIVAELYLNAEGEIELDGLTYWVEWISGKFLNIRHPSGVWHRSYDSFGFFQCSFVGALERWGLEVPEWLREMKSRRGTFQGHEWELKAYSELECELLVQLMDRVREALHRQGIRPRHWHGAGAIASAELQRTGAKAYIPKGERRPAVQDAIYSAYFGGRTELFRQGEFASAAQYDVNSAYATALLGLPEGRGEWRRSRSWAADGRFSPWGLWRCSWDLDDELETLTPLPFRAGRGIFYPVRGAGWYHTAELKAALRLYPERIRIGEGYVFEPASAAKPFAFVEELYAKRQALAAKGDPAATALKFGLASVWGKLSQATGRDGKRPTYQDYFLAGACTAVVRAWMLDISGYHRDRLIQINTDGVILEGTEASPLDERLGPGLGQLRRTDLQQLLVAQPGMMSGWDAEDGEPIAHTRGFFRKEIDFEKLRAAWREDGPHGQLATRGIRFHGIGTCIASGSLANWRRWIQHRQNLSLHSSRKYYRGLSEKPKKGGRTTMGGGSYQLLPPYEVRPGMSERYEPKLTPVEAVLEQLEWVQGTEQPLLSF
jgi:DNA polymerase type B, organellar and viral